MHFVDVPPPDVIWLAAGRPASGVVPQARVGGRVAAGVIVAGVEHTSTVAVTPLAGEVGKTTVVVDSCGREREAVALLVSDDAESQGPADARPWPLDSVTRDDLKTWIDRLERAGVRANRHNSPDLIGQLIAALRRPVDTVICHALEADPTLPMQAQWALRHPLDLRDGLRLLTRLMGARRTILAVSEGDNRRIYRHLRRTARGEAVQPAEDAAKDISEGESVMLSFEPASATAQAPEPPPAAAAPPDGERRRFKRAELPEPPQSLGLRIVPVRNAYPQADPSLLAWALLSRRLAPGRLPTEVGVLVLDAVAATAVGSIARGSRLIRREPVAVRDHRQEISLLADVWRGTRVIDVMRTLGLADSADDALAVRAGDFLRDLRLPLDAVLDGGELLLHVTAPDPLPAVPEPCIRCGWCLDICPTHVHPAGVLEASQRQDAVMAEQFGVEACIECGLCSYICPSRLPLLEAARERKGAM
jgi:Na+-translocating ferredoxin:NAD+ oxidoreductase RnfC subunit